MPLKEADKIRAQILALLDESLIEQYIASKGLPTEEGHAVREYARYLRSRITQGATDSSFAVC